LIIHNIIIPKTKTCQHFIMLFSGSAFQSAFCNLSRLSLSHKNAEDFTLTANLTEYAINGVNRDEFSKAMICN